MVATAAMEAAQVGMVGLAAIAVALAELAAREETVDLAVTIPPPRVKGAQALQVVTVSAEGAREGLAELREVTVA